MTTWYVDLVGGTDTLQTKSITGATKANPCVITSAAHGYQNGQVIVISGVAGMTQLNGNTYTVDNAALNTYELLGVNSTAYGVYTSGGISTITGRNISGITQANPCVITCIGHGYLNDQYIFLPADVSGMTELNGKCYKVANKTDDTFELSGVDSSGYAAWTVGGTTQRAYLTSNAAHAVSTAGEAIRIGATTAPTKYTSSNLTWTRNSVSVGTSASLVGIIVPGDYIGRTNTTGNGSIETSYRVSSVTASVITIESKYYGTSGTDTASVYKINPITTGAAGLPAITISKNIDLSGGWNLATTIQDGETWIKPNGLRTATTVRGIDIGSVCTVSKLNIVEAYRNYMTGSSSNAIASYCSFCGTYSYGFEISGNNNIISNCMINGSGAGAYACVYLNAAYITTFLSDSVMISGPTGYGVACAQTGPTINGGTYAGCARGVDMGAINSTVENASVVDCPVGFYPSGHNTKISNCSVLRCPVGVVQGSVTVSFLITGVVFESCSTYGVQIYQSRTGEVSDCTFSLCGIDVYIDGYSGEVNCINNSHTTPTTYAYSRTVTTGTNFISNCVIDAPSISKAFQIVAGASYSYPQWILQNSFGGLYGSYYANGQAIKDSTIFRTTGPSLKISYNTSVLVMNTELKIVSCYAKVNQAKKFSLYMKRDSVPWTGTIVPKFKLDGKRITTETTIESLATDWVLYEWTCPAANITTDGELSLGFVLNANSTAIWIDDFTVTDV